MQGKPGWQLWIDSSLLCRTGRILGHHAYPRGSRCWCRSHWQRWAKSYLLCCQKWQDRMYWVLGLELLDQSSPWGSQRSESHPICCQVQAFLSNPILNDCGSSMPSWHQAQDRQEQQQDNLLEQKCIDQSWERRTCSTRGSGSQWRRRRWRSTSASAKERARPQRSNCRHYFSPAKRVLENKPWE